MTGIEELAAAHEFLLFGDGIVVVAEEEAGLFNAFGEQIAETANVIITNIQAFAEEGEVAAQRVIDQFVGL